MISIINPSSSVAVGTSATKFFATNTTGQSISNVQTTGWVATTDTSSILHAGGDYVTIPKTGYYGVSATTSIDLPATQPMLDVQAKIYVDTGGGFALLDVGCSYSASLTYAATLSISSTVTALCCHFNAGDKVAIWFQQDTGGAKPMTTTAGWNHWSLIGMI